MISSIKGSLKKAKKTVKKTAKKKPTVKKKIKLRVKVPDTKRKPGGSAPFVPKPGGSRPIEKPSMKSVKKATAKVKKVNKNPPKTSMKSTGITAKKKRSPVKVKIVKTTAPPAPRVPIPVPTLTSEGKKDVKKAKTPTKKTAKKKSKRIRGKISKSQRKIIKNT